jgi:hypothetical protein
MATPRPRSGALIISVYIDGEGDERWFARLRGFDDPLTSDQQFDLVSDREDLVAAVRAWLETILGDV